jgi:hypothetical protein
LAALNITFLKCWLLLSGHSWLLQLSSFSDLTKGGYLGLHHSLLLGSFESRFCIASFVDFRLLLFRQTEAIEFSFDRVNNTLDLCDVSLVALDILLVHFTGKSWVTQRF